MLHVLTQTFFPFLSRHPEKHQFFVMIAMGTTILASIILFILSPWLVNILLSPEFAESIVVIRILSISLVFTMLFYCYGMCYLVIHKKEKMQRQITVYISLFGFALSWWLIREYSYIGAALTISICRILLGTITFVTAKRII